MKFIKEYYDFESHRNVTAKSDFEIIKNILLKECSESLSFVKDHGYLYRGVKNPTNVFIDTKIVLGFYEKIPRRDRKPLDMKKEISTLFDNSFIKNFGINLRSESVFASLDKWVASEYNDYEDYDYIIFPVDGFDYYKNNNISDLYTNINDKKWYADYKKFIMNPYNNDFFYKGIKLEVADIMNPIDLYNYLKNNYKIFNLTDEGSHLLDNDNKQIINVNNALSLALNNLEKKPKMSESEFNEYRIEEIEKIVKNYKKNDTFINNNHELSIVCDKYYLVDSRYISELNNLIFKTKI